ncbi:MAG: hypothetical protein SNJ84_01960 [Verrucomicrobiia bacterium]
MSESTASCACGSNSGACSNPAPATTGIQNGKGDAPRNISETFRRNFDTINWSSDRSKRVEGRRTVKVY